MRIALILALTLSAFAQEKPYRSYLTGNPADAHTKTTFGVAMLGGGGDVDEAYQWLCERSGGGDFVVLRASGEDGYNEYLYKLCKLDSVESIVTLSREAGSDPYVLQQIRNAEAIFFAGGDQANYVRFWKGTPLNDEINKAIARGIPVGGVSAGLAILGEFSFSAMYTDETNKDRDSSITSEEALANPYDPKLTLERDFIKIPQLKGVITDSHFSERNRLGRLAAFMARVVADGWSRTPTGVGIDEKTAILLNEDGTARVTGNSGAGFIRFRKQPKKVAAGKPLDTGDLLRTRFTGKEPIFSFTFQPTKTADTDVIRFKHARLYSLNGMTFSKEKLVLQRD